ncbi:hypothetical protein [Pedobacter sp. NJ-S-72]
MNIKTLLTIPLLTVTFFSFAQEKSYTQQIEGTQLAFTMQAIPAGEFLMGARKENLMNFLYIR